MTEIHTDFFNFSEAELLSQILPNSNEYEFTSNKIFRKREAPACTCGCKCIHNGYNYARKKNLGKVKIGKYICPKCAKQFFEDKSHWKNLLASFKDSIESLFIVLRDSNVGYRVIGTIMAFFLPCKKDTIYNLFNKTMDKCSCTVNTQTLIVHYDEQHPKRGRNQKFRLTLLDAQGKVIADNLYENKDKKTIKEFLLEHLDPKKEIVIVTDCDNGYPALFKEIWGNRIRQQKCLLHLNKLICKDFGKNTDLIAEYNKYCLLNIFYDRSKELEKLGQLMKKMELERFETKKEKWDWICEAKQEFREFLKKQENRRRKKGKSLKQRTLSEAEEKFTKILFQKGLFSKPVQKRIDMIKDNWDYFTTFYHVEDCPATNNIIENYYSTSLKTHRKKQFRTDRGLMNHMKLAALKRLGNIGNPKTTFFEIFLKIHLIAT